MESASDEATPSATAPEPVHFELGKLEFKNIQEGDAPHPLQTVVLPILGLKNGVAKVYGTAFSIGKNLALTATHVFREDGEFDGELDDMAVLFVRGKGDRPARTELLPIIDVTAHPEQTDVAVVRLAVPMEDDGTLLALRPLRLGMAPPTVGEECATFGYTTEPDDAYRSVDEILAMNPQLNVSHGVVVDYYPTGAALCRYPCFQLDGRADHQMSGGPILSTIENGLMAVRGVVSTGFTVMEGEPP